VGSGPGGSRHLSTWEGGTTTSSALLAVLVILAVVVTIVVLRGRRPARPGRRLGVELGQPAVRLLEGVEHAVGVVRREADRGARAELAELLLC
jgi:hypothetical protein